MLKNESQEALIYKIAGLSTIIMLIIIPIQIIVFALNPIPSGVESWFKLFVEKPLIGFFHADFFIMVNNILIAIIYYAFYCSLKDINKKLLQLALLLGFIGIAAYLSSNKTFELLSLARSYSTETDSAAKQILLSSGKTMLLSWQGTAFDAYYVLNGATLIIVSLIMIRSQIYGRITGFIGLSAGFFMVIPSTAGKIGLVFSLLSLIPWYVFSIRFCIVFFRLAGGKIKLDQH